MILQEVKETNQSSSMEYAKDSLELNELLDILILGSKNLDEGILATAAAKVKGKIGDFIGKYSPSGLITLLTTKALTHKLLDDQKIVKITHFLSRHKDKIKPALGYVSILLMIISAADQSGYLAQIFSNIDNDTIDFVTSIVDGVKDLIPDFKPGTITASNDSVESIKAAVDLTKKTVNLAKSGHL